MMKKKNFLIGAIVFALFLFSLYNIIGAFYIRQQQNTRLAEFLPTPVISNEENIMFYDIIGQEVDLNNGVTMEIIPLLQPTSEPLQSPNHFDFVVFNNTAEPIKFQDQGFGLEVYAFEGSAWKLLELKYAPIISEKSLPPKLKKLDFDIANMWSLFEENLYSLPSRNIRLYIHGVGEKTNNLYGAYMDISLPQNN